MLKQLSLLVAATALSLAPASAAVPTISGKYAFSEQIYCQPVLSGNGGLNNEGEETHNIATITFDSATLTLSYKGVRDSGAAILLPSSGTVFNESKVSVSGTYSNTASTVTINGNTYNVEYGQVAKGIVTYFTMMRLETNDSGATCSALEQMSRI